MKFVISNMTQLNKWRFLNGSTFARIQWHKDVGRNYLQKIKNVGRNTLISSNQLLDTNCMAFVLLISSPNYIVVNIHQHHPAAPNSYHMYLVNLLTWIPHSSEDHSTPGKLSIKGVAKRHVYYKLYEDQILQSRERRMKDTQNYTRFIRWLFDRLKECVSWHLVWKAKR